MPTPLAQLERHLFAAADLPRRQSRQGAGRFSLRAMPFAVPLAEKQIAGRERDQALEAGLEAEGRNLSELGVPEAGPMDFLTGRMRVTSPLAETAV